MAQPALFNTYDLTVGVIVDMEDMLHMLDPFEVPLLGMQGADGRSAISRGTCFEKKVEWLDEELLIPKSTVAVQIGNTTTATSLTVASGHSNRFSTGDVVTAGTGEKLRLTSTSATTADTWIVTRAFAGSSVTTLATNETVLIIGQALPEGSNPEDPRAKSPTARSNVTQIFGPTAIRVSATENVVRKYGLSGTTQFDHQVANRTKEHFIQLEQAIQYGKASAGSEGGSGSINEVRTMGGFTDFITTYADATATTFTETYLLDRLQFTFNAGGRPDRAMMGAALKRKASAWTKADTATITLNESRASNVRGAVVDYYDSDFGRISLLLNRWTDAGDLFCWDRDQATLHTLRPTQFEMLAKTGDSLHGQIVGEYTLRFRRERHALYSSNLS